VSLIRRVSNALSKDEILARHRTLDLIERPLKFGGPGLRPLRRDSEFFLQNHPNPETALRIEQQMNEIAVMIEKMNEREQSGNRVIILSASAFLVTCVAYSLFQLSDINTVFTSALPSLFTVFEYSTARKLLSTLARFDLLPVDFASEDPYMIRTSDIAKKHPRTRPMRLCIPVGLGAGIDVDCDGPWAFLKFGFGSIEVGPVSIDPQNGFNENNVQLIGTTVVSDTHRRDSSKGFQVLADRLCDYIDRRVDDLLTRNTVTGITVIVNETEDIDKICSHARFMEKGDFMSIDVSHLQSTDVLKILQRLETATHRLSTITMIFLKVGLNQSFPPSEEVAAAIKKSTCVVGVNINGAGLTSHNAKITKFITEGDVRLAGLPVREKSTEAVANWFIALGEGKSGKEIIASGGVYNGQDALEKIEAGASLVNVFSAFVTDGPPVARRIKTQLSVRLMNKGYYNLDEVIGARHRIVSKRLQDVMKNRKRF